MTDGGAIEAEVARVAADRELAASLRSRLAAAREHAAHARHRADELRVTLTDEERDVAQLESMSWVRIWATLRGGRATDLERETAERDAARYAAAEAEHRASVAAVETQGIEDQLRRLGDVDAAWADVLADKERWLHGRTSPAATRLLEIAAQRGELAAAVSENREAQAAGIEARRALGQGLELLRSAGSWSTWDAFGGGGLLTDLVKYDKLNQVQDLLHWADDVLGRFARELADVGLDGVDPVQLDGLTRTFDVWFDNIFSDLAVRSRIGQATERVDRAVAAVERILAALRDEAGRLAAEATALDAERERLIRTA